MIEHKACPTCGSKRIHLVKRSLSFTSSGKPFAVPSVVFHECPNCGEQVFSPEAMNKIEARRPKRRKAAA